MKYLNCIKLSFLLIGFMFCNSVHAQNMETMFIEKMERVSLVFPEQCSPDDLIIVINSSLPGLKFESNMLPVEEFIVIHNERENQYIICHEKIKFKLTVSGTNLQSEDIEIFELEKPLAFRISANTAKGIVHIITNPRNSTVIFPVLNNLVLSSNQPITNVSGKYRINIVKAQYKNIDTMIVIPRDAEKTYNIDLVPLFARIKLDLRTDDNSLFLKVPVLWIDSVKIELDAMVKPGMNQRSFFDDVEFLKFYEGNIIPINEGIHKIKVEAESYIPFETTIDAKNGKLHNISVSLEPIFGYLTFVDKQLAEGATIFVNNQKVGKVPLFKAKTRVGNHKVRFEKLGFISLEDEYALTVDENKITDFDVSMLVARRINFQTTPSSSEIMLDGTRIGFTPVSALVNAGSHEILIRKSGFATEKISKLIGVNTPEEETVKYNLRSVTPLNITSEENGLTVNIMGMNENQNIAVEEVFITPANIPLPYGNYGISLNEGKKVLYKSTIRHAPEILKKGKLPVYSRSSFQLLEASIGLKQGTGSITEMKQLYDVENFEASFGRIHVFPGSGLSSALLNVDYKLIKTDSINFKTLAPNIFFLNWDWRLGGSILRQIDVNLLGRFKYTPGLKFIGSNISGFADVQMLNYFYGIEISTRLSYLNINFKTGMQVSEGKLNYWDSQRKKYGYSVKGIFVEKSLPLPKFEELWVGSIGFSLNGNVYNSNKMLRLWHKPLFDPARKKSKINKADSQSTPNINGKTKFFQNTKKAQ